MAQILADRKDIDFVLYEMMDLLQLLEHEKYSGFNKKTLDMILTEARTLGIKEILPTFAPGDKVGVRFENGQVRVPECFHKPCRLLAEGEWTAMTEDPDLGGQGLPHAVAQAAMEYLVGANFPMSSYVFMAHGAGKMIELYGTEKQKELYLKNLYSGKWAGSMLLTESQAGSDVGALTTTAKKNEDGSYTLTGNKVFITAGEHDVKENIIHPVLARIEGAPSGTRGISIFIVPKFLVHEDGSLGEKNDIICTGIEEKMGLHGSATCSMALGSKTRCTGWLLGEENKGMRIMFHMMNESRLFIGFQAFGHASAAYLYALAYARERVQGRDLAKAMDKDAPPVPIIRHPDVKRMLLWMKAHVEGMRGLLYYVATCFDRAELAQNPEKKEKYNNLTELLTPLVKAYCSQRGFEVCIQAIQVYGGAGYTREYPVEQLARDAKIASIYEGTDGIQAMDLLGRKLAMKKGAVFTEYLAQMEKTTALALKSPLLQPLAESFQIAVKRLGETAMNLGMSAMGPDFLTAFAFAHPFLEVMGDVSMAWILLWRAVIAEKKPVSHAKGTQDPFYEGQIKSAQYYIRSVLPAALGRMEAISLADPAVTEITDAAFGG